MLIKTVAASAVLLALAACDSRPPVSNSRSDSSVPASDQSAPFAPPVAPAHDAGVSPCSTAPQLSLVRRGDRVIARLINTTCAPLWRVIGCCGEGEPIVEARREDGSWGLARCMKGPQICCDAGPTCGRIAPGATVELDVSGLSAAVCCGTTFRVKLAVKGASECMARFGQTFELTSNALKLRDADTCTFPKTDCGETFCDATSEVCVEVQPQSSPPRRSCQQVPPKCGSDHSCNCLRKEVCGTGTYSTCADMSGQANTVTCSCPHC